MNKRRSVFFEITVIALILIIGATIIYLTIAHNNQSQNVFNPRNNHFIWNLQNQKIGKITNINGNVVTISVYSRPHDENNSNNSADNQNTNNTTLNITLDNNIKIYTSQGRNKPEAEANKDALTIGSIIKIQYDEDNTTIQKIIVMIKPNQPNN